MTTMLASRVPNADLAHYLRLKSRFAPRHRTAETIHAVRRGHLRQLFPSELEFDLNFEGVPIANFVDIVARDMAEGIAPLPSLACVSGKMKTEADQERAEIKNRIGDWYWKKSRLEINMLRVADQYISYGYVIGFVEPNIDAKTPFLCFDDPRRAVYECDRFGNVVYYGQRWRKSIDDLCAMFPEYQGYIRVNPKTGRDDSSDTQLELVRWVDKKYVTFFLPEREGMQLIRYEHKLDRAPVVVAERPGESDTPRGQFDDVIWVQVARAIMSTLALEAAHMAVQAPVVVPTDADELPIGPHAVWQTDNPQQAKRLDFQVPAAAFAEGQVLDQEMRTGSRYPDARSGGVQASVITGKGVEALLGTFDAQIKGCQMVFKEFLENLTALCFEMDEKWWPNENKTVSGTLSGSSYEFTYTPSKDINGRWGCTVTYGFAAGMQPSQSIITLLQLEGAGLIAKGTTQENLPFSLDHIQEQRKIDVEGLRDALKQGVSAYIQSSGQIVAQGGDPTDLFGLAVDAIKQIQNGKPVEDAIATAYAALHAKQQAEQQAQEEAQQQAQAASGQDELAQPPSTPPTLNQMVDGFRGSGNLPVMQAQIRRSVPTGIQ